MIVRWQVGEFPSVTACGRWQDYGILLWLSNGFGFLTCHWKVSYLWHFVTGDFPSTTRFDTNHLHKSFVFSVIFWQAAGMRLTLNCKFILHIQMLRCGPSIGDADFFGQGQHLREFQPEGMQLWWVPENDSQSRFFFNNEVMWHSNFAQGHSDFF